MNSDIYALTDAQRWEKLAALHQGWGNLELAAEYRAMAGADE